MSGCAVPGTICGILSNEGHHAHSGKSQEDESGYLKPELMKNFGEMSPGGPHGAEDGAVTAGAPNLLSDNASGNSKFPGC